MNANTTENLAIAKEIIHSRNSMPVKIAAVKSLRFLKDQKSYDIVIDLATSGLDPLLRMASWETLEVMKLQKSDWNKVTTTVKLESEPSAVKLAALSALWRSPFSFADKQQALAGLQSVKDAEVARKIAEIRGLKPTFSRSP